MQEDPKCQALQATYSWHLDDYLAEGFLLADSYKVRNSSYLECDWRHHLAEAIRKVSKVGFEESSSIWIPG